MSRFHGAGSAARRDHETFLREAAGEACDEMVHRVVASQSMASHDRHAGAILQQRIAMQGERMVVKGLHHAGKTARRTPRIPLDLIVAVDLQIERVGEGGGVQWVKALVELSRVVKTFTKRLIRNVDPGHVELGAFGGRVQTERSKNRTYFVPLRKEGPSDNSVGRSACPSTLGSKISTRLVPRDSRITKDAIW